MKKQNVNYENIENLTSGERTARVLVSTLAIVVAMESSIAGSAMFAVICLIGVTLAMTGIIGWDPVRALSNASQTEQHSFPHHTDTSRHSV